MNEPNQLDNFLKRKLSERVYEPDPSHWEAAQQLIDEQPGRKKRRWGGWLWLLLLLGTTGSTLGFMYGGLGYPWTSNSQIALSQLDPYADPENKFPIIEQEECSESNKELLLASLASRNNPPSSSATELGTPPSVANQTTQQKSQEDSGWLSGLIANRKAKAASRLQSAPSVETPSFITQEDAMEATSRRTLSEVYGMTRRQFGIEASMAKGNFAKALYTETYEYPKNSLQLDLGIGLASGWNNAGSRLRMGSALPSVGLTYTRSLKPGVRLMAGVAYQGRGALDSDSTYTLASRGFGFRDTLTTVSPRVLHYVAFPISLDARIAGRHYVQVGVQPAILLGATAKLTQSVATDFGEQVISEENTWGYKQGFAQTDLSLILGYRYYVGQGLRLGLGATYGLRDQTDEVFFRNPQINRNFNLRFTLEYDLKQF